MNKFVIFTLTATALVPVSAAAQSSHAASRSHSASSAHSSSRAHSSAISQHRGGHRMMQRHHGGNRQVFMHRRGGGHEMRGGGHMKRGGHHVIRRHHGINRHHNYRRIDRGFIVPQFWWGPQFQIQNWSTYGFAQPMHDRRWVRYYDDALLIDRSGRVHDGRWGMNWDEYGDRWAYDDQGVPYYDGDDGEYYEGEEDYAEEGYGEHPDAPPPYCGQACPPPMPGHGYGYAYPQPGYGYGYGHGWMHGGMVTITETTVHAAAPQTVTETVYIEKKVKSKPRRSYKRAKPRPQPGERG